MYEHSLTLSTFYLTHLSFTKCKNYIGTPKEAKNAKKKASKKLSESSRAKLQFAQPHTVTPPTIALLRLTIPAIFSSLPKHSLH